MKKFLLKAVRPDRVAPFFLFLGATHILAQDVVISEFMASNSSTLTDSDSDYEDWIEIYNQSDSILNLGGWHLTDDPADLDKWTFPETILDPGGILVVFASNKNRKESGDKLHTNFKLSSSGEYLGLVRPDGVTVENDFGPTYPQQVVDVSYGLRQSTTSTTILGAGSPAKYHIPVNGDLDVLEGRNPDSWIGSDFDHAGWSAGMIGMGFASGSPDPFDPFIETDLLAVAYGRADRIPSVYIRIPFAITDPTNFAGLSLKMKYDDGFVAYLNGAPLAVAEALAPDPDELTFESVATANHNDADAIIDEEFVLSSSLLEVGKNVLCIHGMNRAYNSSDMLFSPTLEGLVIGGTFTASFFTTPTPGGANVAGSAAPGPLIKNVTRDPGPLNPASGDLVIEAEVVPTLMPLASVALVSRIMYQAEATVPMRDDGTGVDATAGDGIFSASIPLSEMSAGEMLRWKVTAEDSDGVASRQPIFPDRLDSPEYFGTITEDPSVGSSNLPIFHWFTANPSGATNPSGSRGSVFYLDRFYDNIQADRHGQSTGGFPKKSYDFDFNKGNRFLPYEGGMEAKDINMITNWADKSKTRNTIGYEMMRKSGHPAHYAFPVRIQQNGSFFSTADLVEDGDDNYLDRVGLDGKGALYKMYNRMDSASSGVNKKTRKSERNDDLAALIAGLGLSTEARLRYGYDNLNIPGTVNYLAALDMTNNRDHGHKNYYVYRDTEGSGEWRPLVWDIDLCLGRNWVGGPAYFDDTFTNNHLRAGPSNRLKTFVFNDPVLNRLYLRRLRTLMDRMLGTPAAPVNYLPDRVNELVALIDPNDDNPSNGNDDADLDYQKWGSWGNRNAMRAGAARIINEFVPSRRSQLYGLSEIPAAQPVAAPINIGTIDFNPVSSGGAVDQGGEYFVLANPNSYEVDCSDWTISGGISMTLPAGTVIPRGGDLHIGRSAVGFRARLASPKASEKRYLVSGYNGQLSARGETITLHDDLGNPITTVTYDGLATPAQKSLRITEIHYNPAEPSASELAAIPTAGASDFEFIELANLGAEDLNLSGAMFSEGVRMTFAPGSLLTPGQRVVVVANREAFELRYGTGFPIVGQFSGNLSNGGEQLQLIDGAGENVLEFTYDDSWHPRTDGKGHSLVLLDPATTAVTDFDLARNWGVSIANGGDPGSASTSVAMTFETWKNREFTSEQLSDPMIVGPLVDLDGDEMNTLFEYAFAFDPFSPESVPAYQASRIEVDDTSYQAMTFRRRTQVLDLSYRVEISADLENWTSIAIQLGPALGNGDGTETVTIRDGTALGEGGPRFIRMVVTLTNE